MGKETRLYTVVKKVPESSSLIELISVEETYSQARALEQGVERLPEADKPGDYAAIAGIAWKPYGARQVVVTGWGEAKVDPPTPPLHRDADGNPLAPGQTDLVDAVRDGEAIPESEVAVDPTPVTIVSDEEAAAAAWEGEPEPEPQVAPQEPEAAPEGPTPEEEAAQAAAAREAYLAEQAARDEAAAKAQAEEDAKAQAAVEEAQREAARQAQLEADKARAAQEAAAQSVAEPADAPEGGSQQAEAKPSVAEGLLAVQEQRRAAQAAQRRDEPPAPVNAPDGEIPPPSDW